MDLAEIKARLTDIDITMKALIAKIERLEAALAEQRGFSRDLTTTLEKRNQRIDQLKRQRDDAQRDLAAWRDA